MKVPPRSRWTRLWIAAFLGGCTVGSPLVDVVPQRPEGGEPSHCMPVPDCVEVHPPGSSEWAQAAPVEAVELDRCGGGGRFACTGAQDDGGTPQPCQPVGGLDTLRLLGDTKHDCQELTLEIDQATDGGVQLEGVSLHEVNLRLTSDVPIRVELRAAKLREVWLSLAGPVAVRIVASEEVEALDVEGRETNAGTPQIEFEDVDAKDIRIGDPDAPFEGEVSVVRSTWFHAQVAARDLRLESVSYRGGRVDVERLLALDTGLADMPLAAEDSQLAACELTRTRFERCGTLTLLGTKAEVCHFAACSPGPLRAYESKLEGCSVDGTVDADGTKFSLVAFGTGEKTTLRSWGGVIGTCQFCKHARHHQAAGGIVSCSECAEGLQGRHAACLTGDTPTAFPDSSCAAWESASVCENPVERDRPLVHLP